MTATEIVSISACVLVYTWSCMLFGAWIFHRGRSGASPLPTMSRPKEPVSNEPQPLQLPKVRP